MLWQERIESIKAGLVGAVACGLAALLFTELEAFLWPNLRPALGLGPLPWESLGWAIATLTGFLFAITYRYVIRQDPSSHLRSGAVLAFGLVRGLAQVDIGGLLQGDAVLLIVLMVESLAIFAGARLALDLALEQGWIQPFKGFDA